MSSGKLMRVVVPLLIGCLLSCLLNIGINKIQMGTKVAVLPNSVLNYKNQSVPLNTSTDLTPISLVQILKWMAIPSCLSLIIWGIIIWFVTRSKDSVQPIVTESQ